MGTRDDLLRELRRIDGRGYPAYKDLRGSYAFERHTLFVDHVQGDPFAAPSKLRVRVAMAEAQLPRELFEGRVRRIALEDFIAREIRSAIATRSGSPRARERSTHRGRPRGRGGQDRRGSGKSGLIRIDAGGQEVLERTAVVITPEWVEARVEVGLPAAGRRILGREAETLLAEELPALALRGLCWNALDPDAATRFVHCIENQQAIRERLADLGLVAFVANGASLPRESGASDRPLEGPEVVRFASPRALEVEIEVPNVIASADGAQASSIRGMGIPAGVSLIVGGGYHGKSTLLRALERCVHPHIPGDGREWVVSRPDLVKIRAEDGRRVERVDIHPFIGVLPGGRNTSAFCSDDASGSTSQAASIVEAIESGCGGLLLDEDTSATNFMIRDARMQALVHKEHEPITPFLERVREIHETLGVSTILVMGGCGDYFDVADHVIMMCDYEARDATAQAREIAAEQVGTRAREVVGPLSAPTARVPLPQSFDASRGRREVKIEARARDQIAYGDETIDMRGVEQLLDTSQTRAIGFAILLATREIMGRGVHLHEVLDRLEARFDEEGLDVLDPFEPGRGRHPGNFARPRRHEIAAAINRLRSLKIE